MWSLAAPDDRTLDISVRARSIRPGELVVLTVVPRAGADSVQIRAFDRDIPALRTGDRPWAALVGIALDVHAGRHAVSVTAGAAPANSAFGTRSICNRKPRNAHGGADFLSPAGTPVHSPNAGRVVIARPLYFSGSTVIVDRGLGLFSMLAHRSAIDVREGERI